MMRRALRSGILTAGVLAAVSWPPRLARAADDAATREAQTRFDEGLARLRANNFDGARISFAQAYAVLQRPSILWNLALAEERSGEPLEALGHFREFLRQASSDPDRAGAQKHIDALGAQVGHIEVQAPTGTQLAVDGASVGAAPLSAPVDVLPGRHHVEARSSQGTQGSDAEVESGQVAHLSFTPSEPPLLQSLPSAAAPTPSDTSQPPAPAETQGADRPPHSPIRPSPTFWTPRVIATTALGGAALTGLVLGVYFGLQSQSEENTASGYRALYRTASQCSSAAATSCPQLNDAVQAQNRDAMLSDVFYVAGGVLAVGAVATWLFWPSGAKSKAAAWVIPAAGPGTVGVASAGQF